jgi:site-specific recombinase XerD
MDEQAKTLGEFCDEWLETVIKGAVGYSTYIYYSGYINNHIKRFMGDKPLVEIRATTVQQFVYALIEEKRLSARTIDIIVTMLKSALNYAEDYEYIVKNPCRRIKLPKVEEQEVEVFTNTEQTRIFSFNEIFQETR